MKTMKKLLPVILLVSVLLAACDPSGTVPTPTPEPDRGSDASAG